MANALDNFNAKIESMKDHSLYSQLRKHADKCILDCSGFGLERILADEFIQRIEMASIKIIRDWLDGKNNLEWSIIKQHSE